MGIKIETCYFKFFVNLFSSFKNYDNDINDYDSIVYISGERIAYKQEKRNKDINGIQSFINKTNFINEHLLNRSILINK